MRWLFISSSAIWVTGPDTSSVASRGKSELTISKCERTRIWTIENVDERTTPWISLFNVKMKLNYQLVFCYTSKFLPFVCLIFRFLIFVTYRNKRTLSKAKYVENGPSIKGVGTFFRYVDSTSPMPKGQLISECLFDFFLSFPKNQREIWQISVPESKK